MDRRTERGEKKREIKGREEGKIETETKERDNRELRRSVNILRKVRGRQKKVDGGWSSGKR